MISTDPPPSSSQKGKGKADSGSGSEQEGEGGEKIQTPHPDRPVPDISKIVEPGPPPPWFSWHKFWGLKVDLTEKKDILYPKNFSKKRFTNEFYERLGAVPVKEPDPNDMPPEIPDNPRTKPYYLNRLKKEPKMDFEKERYRRANLAQKMITNLKWIISSPNRIINYYANKWRLYLWGRDYFFSVGSFMPTRILFNSWMFVLDSLRTLGDAFRYTQFHRLLLVKRVRILFDKYTKWIQKLLEPGREEAKRQSDNFWNHPFDLAKFGLAERFIYEELERKTIRTYSHPIIPSSRIEKLIQEKRIRPEPIRFRNAALRTYEVEAGLRWDPKSGTWKHGIEATIPPDTTTTALIVATPQAIYSRQLPKYGINWLQLMTRFPILEKLKLGDIPSKIKAAIKRRGLRKKPPRRQLGVLYEIQCVDPRFTPRDFLTTFRKIFLPTIMYALLKRDVDAIQGLCTPTCYRNHFKWLEKLPKEIEELRPIPIYSWSDLDKLPDQELPQEVCRFLNQAELQNFQNIKRVSTGKIFTSFFHGQAPALILRCAVTYKLPNRYSPLFVSMLGGWGGNHGISPVKRERTRRMNLWFTFIQDPTGDSPDWELLSTNMGKFGRRYWRHARLETLRRRVRARLERGENIDRLQFMGDDFLDQRIEAEGVSKLFLEEEEEVEDLRILGLPKNVLELERKLNRIHSNLEGRETV